MHFVLTLHSHLPYLLNHGRWPEGSDWLCEATLDSYLPLLEVLLELEREGLPAPLTLGFTPVLANQLASPGFREEMHAFLEQRLQASTDAFPAMEETGPQAFGALAGFWRDRFERLQALFEEIDGDLVRAFRRLADDGRIELISSAATPVSFHCWNGRKASACSSLSASRNTHGCSDVSRKAAGYRNALTPRG